MVVEQIVILTRLSEHEAHAFEAVNKVKVKNEYNRYVLLHTFLYFEFTIDEFEL